MALNIDMEVKKALARKITDIIMKIPDEVIKFDLYSTDNTFQMSWKQKEEEKK